MLEYPQTKQLLVESRACAPSVHGQTHIPGWWKSGNLKSAVNHTHQNMLYFRELSSKLIAEKNSPSKKSEYIIDSMSSDMRTLRYNLNEATSQLLMLSTNQHTPKNLCVILKKVTLVIQEKIEIQECQK
jgi:hypothetical protein